jgi:hypothetical protein
VLYFHLQKKWLSTASDAKIPYLLSDKEEKETLLLSPFISGVASDTVVTLLVQAYAKTQKISDKITLKKAIEILIEAFISHAVLGDLLGRNDRHLMNSLMDSVVEGIPQKMTLEALSSPEKILAYAETIATQKTKAISLIDIDLKWLLGEKNTDWALAEIDCGLSELNLLSLLPAFNDYNAKTNPFFEKRKAYIAHYFTHYCQTQDAILEKKELLFSTVKKIYPSPISEQKLKLLGQRIHFFEKSKVPVIKFFKRYLVDFRIRWVHKATLLTLARMAHESNSTNLLNALKETDLLKYLPPQSTFAPNGSSVLLELQCFRGVLSKKDQAILSEKERETWEAVAANISMMAEKFNSQLFTSLEDKKQFIQQDAAVLLKSLLSSDVS